jgi:hypothetical protein
MAQDRSVQAALVNLLPLNRDGLGRGRSPPLCSCSATDYIPTAEGSSQDHTGWASAPQDASPEGVAPRPAAGPVSRRGGRAARLDDVLAVDGFLVDGFLVDGFLERFCTVTRWTLDLLVGCSCIATLLAPHRTREAPPSPIAAVTFKPLLNAFLPAFATVVAVEPAIWRTCFAVSLRVPATYPTAIPNMAIINSSMVTFP